MVYALARFVCFTDAFLFPVFSSSISHGNPTELRFLMVVLIISSHYNGNYRFVIYIQHVIIHRAVNLKPEWG